MQYGLYLSATGVMANSHRQDVIANNLANAETTGFKRDLPLFQERLTEAQVKRGLARRSNLLLEDLGGGMLLSPTIVDHAQGDLEETGRAMDVGVFGSGYLAVKEGGKTLLTRDGRLITDKDGYLITGGSNPAKVLDHKGNTIQLNPSLPVLIDENGQISQQGEARAKLGLYDVKDRSQLIKVGEGRFLPHAGPGSLIPAAGQIRSGFLERANVQPATELTQLIETQRQLEANANMIRYQDAMLGRLVNDVGKIG
jgi:flagellar basal-body rod protein FlgF